MYMFRMSRRKKHNGANPMFLSLLVQKLYRLQFPRYFIFDDLCWPQYWPDLIFCESCRYMTDLSNVVSRLSLKCLFFEIWRGGRIAPPLPESNLSEPARNRVKLEKYNFVLTVPSWPPLFLTSGAIQSKVPRPVVIFSWLAVSSLDIPKSASLATISPLLFCTIKMLDGLMSRCTENDKYFMFTIW